MNTAAHARGRSGLAAPVRRSSRGVTLIELMVSIAIGLFIVIAVASVMVTQEGIRRNATTGSDATANAAVASLLLERSIKNGGYGMNSAVPGGLMDVCTPQGISAKNSARATPEFSFAAFEFAPVVINPSSIPAGDTNTHVIRVTYSGNQIFGAAALNAIAVSPVRVPTRAGLNTGDLVVLGQASNACIFRQVTALPNNLRCSTPADLANSDVVQFADASYKNDYASCADTAQRWNGDGTFGTVTFVPTTSLAAGLRLYDVGPADRFQSIIYAVRKGTLVMCNFMTQPCENAAKLNDATVWQQLVDDVVSLRAEYGIDGNDDNVIDSWTTITPAAMVGGWNGTTAIRIAVTTRAKNYEKDEVIVDTGAGKNSPVWVGGDINVSHVADWKHYRYTVNQNTIVLKNAFWRD